MGELAPHVAEDGILPLRQAGEDVLGLVMLDKADDQLDGVVPVDDVHGGVMAFGDLVKMLERQWILRVAPTLYAEDAQLGLGNIRHGLPRVDDPLALELVCHQHHGFGRRLFAIGRHGILPNLYRCAAVTAFHHYYNVSL